MQFYEYAFWYTCGWEKEGRTNRKGGRDETDSFSFYHTVMHLSLDPVVAV